ncbi:MAG: hypothetical protein ABR974_13525 [Bacteroidales bacterium]
MNRQISLQGGLLISIFLLTLVTWSNNINGQTPGMDSLDRRPQKDIRQLVKENRVAANRWWYTWLVGYSAATVTFSGIAIASPELKTKQDMWNNAATTFLGVAGLLVTPLIPKDSEINKLVASDNDPGHICTDADFSKAMLKEIAEREQFGRSWKVHAITGIVNIGSGLVTWLGFKRSFGEGLETFAINTVVTETQIWTQPIRARKDYKNYMLAQKNGRLAGPAKPSGHWFVSATPGGVNLKLKF